MMSASPHVLLLAHVFPRTFEDSMGAFLLHLTDAVAPCGIGTDVVAPHAAGLAGEQVIGAARVHRFRYAPARWERLAYRGTMHELVAHGLANKFLFVLFNLGFLLKALSVTWAVRPQILHAHWCLPGGLTGALVSVLTHTPLVITMHGTDVEMLRRTQWALPVARFVFSRARAITCGSTYLREALLALGVADAARMSVIPMPLSPLFQDSGLAVSGSDVEVLTVTRLTKQKSVDTVIEAMAILRDRGSQARLTVIGDGPERAALEAQVQTLDLSTRVHFEGALPQKDLPARYARCGAFVLPSINEGMGLVYAEALLCGAPVIATSSGGVMDIVKDGETGLLVPVLDAHALAYAIEKLLNDRRLAEQFVANGRATVLARFSSEQVAAQFAEIYRHVAMAV